jgi:hypothetical protein
MIGKHSLGDAFNGTEQEHMSQLDLVDHRLAVLRK